jgi:hypothetical protein
MKKNGKPDTMGVTPGIASTARNGSPNVPGISRTSARDSVTERAGSGRTPRMTTSAGSPADVRPEVFPASPCVVAGPSVDVSSPPSAAPSPVFAPLGSGTGAWNVTSNRILTEMGIPSRRAGSNSRSSACDTA